MWEYSILTPDGSGTYQRNDFCDPRLLDLPIHWKAQNPLTRDTWSSFINSNLLFWLPVLCCKTPIYPGPSLWPPWSSFLRVTWDAASWAYKTYLSTFRLCMSFFGRHHLLASRTTITVFVDLDCGGRLPFGTVNLRFFDLPTLIYLLLKKCPIYSCLSSRHELHFECIELDIAHSCLSVPSLCALYMVFFCLELCH